MGYGGSPCGRPMNAPTVYQQLSYKIKIASMPYSGINAIHLSKLSPRKDCGGTPPTLIFNFPFSIFHFQFEISVRESLFSLLRNYLLKLTAAVYCTVTVIVTLDVLLSTSVTEYVTLYLPLRVVTTLPTTLISDEMSLPQVSTAVTPVSA